MVLCWVSLLGFQKKKTNKTKNKGGKNSSLTKTQEVACVDEREWVQDCVQKVQQSKHNIRAVYTRTKTLLKLHTHARRRLQKQLNKMHSNFPFVKTLHKEPGGKIGPGFTQIMVKGWEGVLDKCSMVVI